MEDWRDRTAMLIGNKALDRLAHTAVAVFGLGGVGSFTAEALARAGVGRLVLVDGDERTGRVMGVYVSDDHTPAMLPVFAYGPGADKFCGTYMNTEIARRIKSLIK